MTMDSPWHEAYRKLKEFVKTGATQEDVALYVQLLRKDLPTPSSPEEQALMATVIAEVIADTEDALSERKGEVK